MLRASILGVAGGDGSVRLAAGFATEAGLPLLVIPAGKWPEILVALARVLRDSKPVELLVDRRRRRVWLVFAGNCRYQPAAAAPAYRPTLPTARSMSGSSTEASR